MAVTLAVLGAALTGGPAQAAGITGINVTDSRACLDNDTNNALTLQMWTCTGGPEQQWVYDAGGPTTIINVHTSWYITAPSGLGGGPVAMRPCVFNAPNQQWTMTFMTTPVGVPFAQFWLIENPATGLCLWTDSIRKGTVPAMAGCDPLGSYNEWWSL